MRPCSPRSGRPGWVVSKEGEGNALVAGKGEARLQEAWVLTTDLSAPCCPAGPSLQNSPALGCGQPLPGSPRPSPQCFSPYEGLGSHRHTLVTEETRWSAGGGPPVLAQSPEELRFHPARSQHTALASRPPPMGLAWVASSRVLQLPGPTPAHPHGAPLSELSLLPWLSGSEGHCPSDPRKGAQARLPQSPGRSPRIRVCSNHSSLLLLGASLLGPWLSLFTLPWKVTGSNLTVAAGVCLGPGVDPTHPGHFC